MVARSFLAGALLFTACSASQPASVPGDGIVEDGISGPDPCQLETTEDLFEEDWDYIDETYFSSPEDVVESIHKYQILTCDAWVNGNDSPTLETALDNADGYIDFYRMRRGDTGEVYDYLNFYTDDEYGCFFRDGGVELVAQVDAGAVLCHAKFCSNDGIYAVEGDFPSFSTWTFEIRGGALVDSYTDVASAQEWPTTFIPRPEETLRTLMVVSAGADGSVTTTTMNLRDLGCPEGEYATVLEPESVTTAVQSSGGSSITDHTVTLTRLAP